MRLNATRLGSIASSRSFGDQLYDLAGQVPGLDLNFAGTKTLDPRVTFTRASSATFVDSSGVLRSAVTNLLLRSEEFDNASWNKNGSVTSNQIAAPNGTVTADLLTAAAATFSGNARQDPTIVSGLTYTLSAYLKKNNWRYVGFRFNTFVFGGTERVPFYDFDTDTVSNGGNALATISRTSVGDGWVRLIVTFAATSTNGITQIWLTDSTGATAPAKAGTESVYLWGAQLEQSSTVGDYVPTGATINSAPRFDHNPTTGESLGLLVEEARTNSIRNNTGVGAVAGTPGTLPTSSSYFASGGLTTSVIGTGTQNGINYVDIRLNGTTTTTFLVYAFDNVAASASAGQAWTESFWVSIVGGSATNVSTISVNLRQLGGSSTVFDTTFTPTTTLTRVSGTATLGTGATGVVAALAMGFSAGVAIDITLRFGLPQLELGAFATSPILTSSATVTRAADVASITGSNFSSFYNQTEGTVFVDVSVLSTADLNQSISFNDGTANNRFELRPVGLADQVRSSCTVGNINQYDNSFSLTSLRRLVVLGIKPSDTRIQSGSAGVTCNSFAAMPVVDRLYLNYATFPSGEINGTIKRLTYWPTRLANTTLQQITQP